MLNMPGYCLFHEIWLENSEYVGWLEKDPDKHKARCKVCVKSFGLGTMGEAALRVHMSGKKHIALMRSKMSLRTPSITDFISSQRPTDEAGSSQPPAAAGPSRPMPQQQQQGNVWSMLVIFRIRGDNL